MIFARPRFLTALLFIAAALPASAAELERVEARFEIFGFAGLHLLTNRTTVQERGDRYAIATELATRGLASVFVDLTSHSEVHGKFARYAPLPDAYRADVRRNGDDRHYGVDYRGDGTVTNVSTPPPSERPFFVGAEQMRGTVDQLTAYFLLERQLAQHGTCRVVVPVFDGSGLYNLRFTDVKRETLSDDAGADGVRYRIRRGIGVSRRTARTWRRPPPDEGVSGPPRGPGSHPGLLDTLVRCPKSPAPVAARAASRPSWPVQLDDKILTVAGGGTAVGGRGGQ